MIDSGIDASHPEFAGRVLGGISYVGGDWRTDTCGHGTFVAGEIAANPFNNVGIAGLAFNAELLVAKVVEPDCNVSTEGEVKAIRWAVANGARVINLSIGGTRDPAEPDLDSFSAGRGVGGRVRVLEGRARRRRGRERDPDAEDPLALCRLPGRAPARARRRRAPENGSVPDFSNRDKQYVDIAAPGAADLLDDPAEPGRRLDRRLRGPAYSNCGPSEFQEGSERRSLAPQVDRCRGPAARDRSEAEAVASSSGCSSAPPPTRAPRPAAPPALSAGTAHRVRRSRHLGCDRSARRRAQPPDAGHHGAERRCRHDGPPVRAARGRSPRHSTTGTTRWTSTRSSSPPGEELFARLGTASVAPNSLLLGNRNGSCGGPARSLLPNRAALSSSVAGQQRLGYVAPVAGTYYLEVKDGGASRGPTATSSPSRSASPPGRLLGRAAPRRPRRAACGQGCRRRAFGVGRPS